MSLPAFVQVGARVVVADRGPGILCMDNEDGTWNVELDDGMEVDVPAQQIQEEEALREMPTGVRIVADPDKEPKPEGWTRFVCFSDTHGLHDAIPQAHRPAADVLLHAGDFSNTGEPEEIASFARWLEAYPAEHKVVIAGNHDITFHEEYYRDRGAARFHPAVAHDCQAARATLQDCPNCLYLQDTATEVRGYRLYGSPWQPEFCDWAFQLPRGGPCRSKWEAIPRSVDVLMTHGPPYGFGDQTSSLARAGCEELRAAIQERAVAVNLAGHLHSGYGCASDGATLYINASTCTSAYKPSNRPIVFDLPPPRELQMATAAAAEARHVRSSSR